MTVGGFVLCWLMVEGELYTTHGFPLLLAQDASRPLEVVSAADARFTSRVELSVRFGKTLLVLECDGVEPVLYPLIRQDLVHQGPRYVVQVGDKVRKPVTSDGMGG